MSHGAIIRNCVVRYEVGGIIMARRGALVRKHVKMTGGTKVRGTARTLGIWWLRLRRGQGIAEKEMRVVVYSL